jgi:8-hydroxy-5-deazaflavin:NADPH oxidoreductase
LCRANGPRGQVDPGRRAAGRHHAFLSGNDPRAKAEIAQLLRDAYKWQHLIDLGDITTARGAEMMLPMWVQLFGLVGSPFFSFSVVGYAE